jgi:hypothetical protein
MVVPKYLNRSKILTYLRKCACFNLSMCPPNNKLNPLELANRIMLMNEYIVPRAHLILPAISINKMTAMRVAYKLKPFEVGF